MPVPTFGEPVVSTLSRFAVISALVPALIEADNLN